MCGRQITMNLLPGLLDELRRNVRFSLRTLRKNPGFAITAMVTLALATGASTAMFGVISAVALRPLPYRDPAKLVWITQILKGNSTDELTITPDFLDWRRLNHSFLYLTAFNPGLRNLTGLAEPMQVSAAKASADLLPALGIQPAKGRNFRREEDQKGKDHVAILSHALWQRSFGGDPAWIGRSITLDGESFEVVGVLPRSFVFPDDKMDLITPLGKNEAAELQRGNSVSIVRSIIGRLKPEVTADAARAELTAIQAALPTFLPWKPRISIRVVPLQKHLLGEVERAAWTLLAATLLLLLIACANVTNLLLAQAARREREIAVRIAVGGSRRSLLAQLLTESLTLGVLASLGGLVIALWSRRLLLTLAPERWPSVESLPIDTNVLGFSIAIAVIYDSDLRRAPRSASNARRTLGDFERGRRGQDGERGHRPVSLRASRCRDRLEHCAVDWSRITARKLLSLAFRESRISLWRARGGNVEAGSCPLPNTGAAGDVLTAASGDSPIATRCRSCGADRFGRTAAGWGPRHQYLSSRGHACPPAGTTARSAPPIR
jgi:predicted permease